MARTIELYDTTLRDGTQAENFNLSVEDKIKICRQLDRRMARSLESRVSARLG